jgi:Asp-tRNA(Asn)/Glu-tRNA(Gln) amidotransferase A subunit family amidase
MTGQATTAGADLQRPHGLGAVQMVAGFADGSLSPVDVAESLFDAIAGDGRDGPAIAPFVLLDREFAMAVAKASHARWRRGEPAGPLDGVPVSVKDLSHVAGWPTRRGSLATADEPVPTVDSPAVALLRASGAVIFGKTTTSEFGWATISESPQGGVTRNPHALDRSAGGSSSGAAAHVAMGWGPLALASDAGGSIRTPASYCGVVGFKPTFASVPQPPQSAFAEFAHLGPIARSVADCRLALQVLSRPDARDPASLFDRGVDRVRGSQLGLNATRPERYRSPPLSPLQPSPLQPQPQRPLRIGWAARFGEQCVPDADVEAGLSRVVQQLQAAGHQVLPIDARWLDTEADAWDLWSSRVFESFVEWDAGRLALLDPRLLRVYHHGESLDMRTLARSRTRLRGMANRVAALFEDIDILLTPATATPALTLGRLAPESHPQAALIENTTFNWFAASPYGYPFNVTQQPALSLPLGRNADGLPFGLQVVGQKYADAALLDFGASIEPWLVEAGAYEPPVIAHSLTARRLHAQDPHP